MNSKRFIYIKLKNNYWCLNQSILGLIWYRIFSRDIFFIQEYKKIEFWKLIFYKWKIFRGPKILKLSVYGQLCIPLYGGYKIFDFYKKNVIRIFHDVKSLKEYNKELKNLKRANALKCAPTINKINIDNRWYSEEYLKSNLELNKRKIDNAIIKEDFIRFAIPLLREIMLWEVPATVSLKKYLEEKINIFKSYDFKKYDQLKVTAIKEYFNQAAQLLQKEGNRKILIILAHGDFSAKNIVVTKSETKLLDWELLTRCSFLHDFYNYFFHILRSSGKKMHLSNVIEESLNVLNTVLNVNTQNFKFDFIYLSKTYRFLYYIERIFSILEFRENIHPEKRIRNLSRNIDVFKKYESCINATINR